MIEEELITKSTGPIVPIQVDIVDPAGEFEGHLQDVREPSGQGFGGGNRRFGMLQLDLDALLLLAGEIAGDRAFDHPSSQASPFVLELGQPPLGRCHVGTGFGALALDLNMNALAYGHLLLLV